MKPKESKHAMTSLRDASIVVAAGVTIVGTVLWLKQGEDARQLAVAAGEEQQKMRVALERLTATLERIETQLQALVAAQPSDAVAPRKSATGPKRTTASDNATPTPPVRRRQSSTPKTSRNRAANGTSAARAEGAE